MTGMIKTGKILLMILVLLVFLVFMPGIDTSAETEPIDTLRFADDSELSSIEYIQVPFYSFKGHYYKYDFPYTDDLFRRDSEKFSVVFAQASLGLLLSAFRNEGTDLDDQFETYLSAAGFSDIYAFGYDKPTGIDTLSGLIAHKKVDDFTLIACSPCGQGYQKEWGGNLQVGNGERHEGFDQGATVMKEQLAAYKERYHITGKVKVWIAGFSRAAAVSNLTAADLIASGQYEDVYAYLFGVPRTTTNPFQYKGIFNICGQYDPITNVPLQSWGYERYGLDLYTPAQETNLNYFSLAVKAGDVSEEMTGQRYRNNPEVNFQIHLLTEFLGEMFPTAEEYTTIMQDDIMKIWTEANPDQIFEILSKVMLELDELDKRQEMSREVFIDYISYIASEHLSGNKRQVEEGSWDPDASLAENFLREHQPSTYIDWAFSDNPKEEVFDNLYFTRMLSITGNMDVSVYYNDTLLGTVDHKGGVEYEMFQDVGNAEGGIELLPVPFMMRDGSRTVMNLPQADNYRIVITSNEPQSAVYYNEVFYLPGYQLGISGKMGIDAIEEGTYELEVDSYHELGKIKPLSGKIMSSVTTGFEYSPVLVMDEICHMDFHLTVSFVLGMLFIILIGLVLFVLVCLIAAIVHKVRRNRGHAPFSPWWVIIPHLILIAFFWGMSEFLANYFALITIARTISAVLSLLFVFFLALRAWICNRSLKNLVVAAGFLVITALVWFFYGKSSLSTYSVLQLILSGVVLAALCVIAVKGYLNARKIKMNSV